MNKNMQKTVLTTSAVLAGMVLGVNVNQNGVHADTTTNAATTAAADTNQQLANLKSQQTANESAVASSNAATMSVATTSANSQITDLNNQIKERQASAATAQQNKIDQVNKDAQAATNTENSAYSSAFAKQAAANDTELKAAQAKVVTEQQKEDKKAAATSTYKQSQDQLNSEHQASLNDIKSKHSEKVQDITKQINTQITQTQDTLNSFKVKLNQDNEKLTNFNAANFFKSILDNKNSSEEEKKDAQDAYNIVTGINGKTKPTASWYTKAVHIGQKNDATSLDNLKATLPLYEQFINIRQDRNLPVPKISLTILAVAMVNADFQTTLEKGGLKHPGYYPSTGENLAESSIESAVRLWMNEEGKWKVAVKQHPDLADKLGQDYVFLKYPKVYGATGHFNNLMDPNMSAYGFAVNGNLDKDFVYTAFDFYDGKKDAGLFSLDEFKSLVNNYITLAQTTKNAVKEDQNQIDQSQANLDKLQNEKTDLINQANDEYNKNVQQENNNFNAKSNSLKSNYEQQVKEIDALPTNTDALQTQLQAKLETLKTNHDIKLKQINDDANAKIATIKSQKVNDPEIDKLNAQIDQIKSDLTKKQQELDSQYQALKAKDQAEYNALAEKLKNSSSETAKGNNDHYTTDDGSTTVKLPDKKNDSDKSESDNKDTSNNGKDSSVKHNDKTNGKSTNTHKDVTNPTTDKNSNPTNLPEKNDESEGSVTRDKGNGVSDLNNPTSTADQNKSVSDNKDVTNVNNATAGLFEKGKNNVNSHNGNTVRELNHSISRGTLTSTTAATSTNRSKATS
ncbi:CAP domain-containing protein [Limosilactobacillus reuteri]|uniref:CAP domain-containing protein n=1 Tax=Limosilactobacillus reuteri TaxID=1598 RepID=UPI001E487D10|nr:CAP domain-containing protein [Limosilactobacillus reuteri]MCC4384078.1 CAP domain-containing protein [Limosilactobacillus reuteri]MCC4420773.1 CAP domain-containing protein [Limosilactobacillus reuteri]